MAERLFPILYLELDAVGLAILLIVLFGRQRTGRGSPDQRYFSALVLSGIAMLALDVFMWLLDGRSFPLARALLSAATAAYYLVTPLVAYFWLRYCDHHIYRDEKRLRRRRAAYLIPFLLNAALCVSSIWTGAVFYLDAANVYHRGAWFAAHGVVALSYLLCAVWMIWQRASARRITPAERVYLTLFMVPPAIGVAVQWSFYGVTILWIMVAVSILFIYINVQNQQIFSDPLTGLNNRRRFVQYLNARAQSPQGEGQRLYALMLDLDRLKHINDTYGHLKGDEVLKQFALTLKSVFRKSDIVYRMGGDEFIGFAGNSSQPELAAERIMERLYGRLREQQERGIQIQCSAGIFIGSKKSSYSDFYSMADRALYAAKRSGKNKYQIIKEKDYGQHDGI